MSLRFLLILVFAVAMNVYVSAQPGRCPKIPNESKWESAEDYTKDRELIVKVLKWLCASPYGLDIEQRDIANAFVLEWLAGSPTVLLNITTDFIPFFESHPELFYSFIHGMALYSLENPDIKDEQSKYQSGFQAVADLITQSKDYSHDKELRDLLKASKKNKMPEYTRLAMNRNEKI